MNKLFFLASLSILLCATPRSSAQDAAPVTATPAPPPAATEAPDPAYAKRILLQLSEAQHTSRFATAYSMFISGAAAITAGLVADLVYDRGYGRVIWVVGAVAEIGGVVNLLMDQPFERMAREADGWGSSQLQSEWARRALTARTMRKVGGFVGLGIGALCIAGGGAVAAGLGDMERDTKQNWTTALVTFGGAFMGAALTSLFVETPYESSYRLAYGSDPATASPVTFSLAPTVGGAALSLHARF